MSTLVTWIKRQARRVAESRSLFGGGVNGPGSGLGAMLPSPVLSGVAVTPETALTMTAVFACINVISTDVASLPLEVKRRLRGGGKVPVRNDPRYELLYCEPNDDTTPMRFFQAYVGHRLGWGNAYAEIDRVRKGPAVGLPGALFLHSPRPMDTYPVKTRDGRLFYKVDAGRRELRAEDVLHHAGLGWDGVLGYSPIALARQAIGLGIGQEEHGASFYGNACSPKGALEVAKKLSPEGFRNLRESYEAVHMGTHNAHRLMILEEGTKFVPYSIDPVDAQYLESRKFQVIEICRIYRVPPHKVGDWSQSHLANVEEANIDYRNTTLGPETQSFRQECDRKLFTRRERAHGLHVAHDFVALMQGDSKARTAYYKERFATGSMSPDMIAEAEGDNPLPDGIGSKFYIPMNLIELGAEPPAAAAPPKTAAAEETPPAGAESLPDEGRALPGSQCDTTSHVIIPPAGEGHQ
jgi:HK97 family phage portal protein